MPGKGQLNVEIGYERKVAFKKYCRRYRVSMLDCIKQLIDYALGREKKDEDDREKRTGRKFIQ